MGTSTYDAVTVSLDYSDGVLLSAGLEFALLALSELQRAVRANGIRCDILVEVPGLAAHARDGLVLTCPSIDGMWANVRSDTPFAHFACDPMQPDRTVVRLGCCARPSDAQERTDLTPSQAANAALAHFKRFHETSPQSQGKRPDMV